MQFYYIVIHSLLFQSISNDIKTVWHTSEIKKKSEREREKNGNRNRFGLCELSIICSWNEQWRKTGNKYIIHILLLLRSFSRVSLPNTKKSFAWYVKAKAAHNVTQFNCSLHSRIAVTLSKCSHYAKHHALVKLVYVIFIYLSVHFAW